ncbi:MAG: phospholipid carrier-dependent glycosyltransferase [Flavobacteriaceae bacterium]|nr:phospholipid carrier-dependent glycosyltransferase [Flavobacteriaceae bacterium]
MIRVIERYPILSIIFSVLVMFSFGVHYLDVTIMEARNFITAREMITDGNWLLTTMNGEPRYQKPPLPTWLAALSGLLFGIKNVIALRLPGILMVAVLGVSSYLFSLKLQLKKAHALINALITITSFYVVAIVIEAPWDIFTHGFMFLGIYHLYQLFKKSKGYWKHTLLAGLFIGLSIMCKGPISIYVLLVPFLIAYGISYKYTMFKAKAFSVFSVLIIALILGGWWYLYVRLVDPETFLAIAAKETGNWSSYNVRPFYYYWSFFVQSGLWTIPAVVALVYPYMKTRVKHLKAYKLSFWWVIMTVILLSVIPEKKSRYLMPVLIPLAINTGFYIDYLVRNFKSINKLEKIPVYFNFIIIGLIAVGFAFLWPFFGMLLLVVNLKLYAFAALVLLLCGIGIFWQLKKKNLKKVFYFTVVFYISAVALIIPLNNFESKTEGQESLSNLKSQALAEGYEVYALETVSPEFIWYFGDKIPSISTLDSIKNYTGSRFGLLSKTLSAQERSLLSKKFTLDSIGVYDLNQRAPEASGHRSRLRNNFYLLTKK